MAVKNVEDQLKGINQVYIPRVRLQCHLVITLRWMKDQIFMKTRLRPIIISS